MKYAGHLFQRLPTNRVVNPTINTAIPHAIVGTIASRSPSRPSPKLVVVFLLTDSGVDSIVVLGVGASISDAGVPSGVEFCGGMGCSLELIGDSDVAEEVPPSMPKERLRLKADPGLGG